MGLCLLSGTFSLLCWLLSHDTESSENLLQFLAQGTPSSSGSHCYNSRPDTD